MSAGIPGRIPKAVTAVERLAVKTWGSSDPADGAGVMVWRDIESQLFGAGRLLREMGQDRAAEVAHFLGALAGHRMNEAELPDAKQGGLFND